MHLIKRKNSSKVYLRERSRKLGEMDFQVIEFRPKISSTNRSKIKAFQAKKTSKEAFDIYKRVYARNNVDHLDPDEISERSEALLLKFMTDTFIGKGENEWFSLEFCLVVDMESISDLSEQLKVKKLLKLGYL